MCQLELWFAVISDAKIGINILTHTHTYIYSYIIAYPLGGFILSRAGAGATPAHSPPLHKALNKLINFLRHLHGLNKMYCIYLYI